VGILCRPGDCTDGEGALAFVSPCLNGAAMDYRCPHCKRTLAVHKLFFKDISACGRCGQKVVLGDFLAFAMAALAMPISALSALYLLSHEFEEYFIAAGYAVSIGMLSGVAVLLLLGRATPYRGRKRSRSASAARKSAKVEAAPQDDAFAPTRVL
jgi:DNA-directed RNA polymerase subunit RPC12/RpoP